MTGQCPSLLALIPSRRRFDLLELGATVDAENVYQVEICRDEPDRTTRVRIHVLDYDALRTYRNVDQIFRLPVVAFAVEKGVAFACQDIQHRSPGCFLCAASAARRDFLLEHDHGANRRVVEGGMQKPLHFALTIIFPGKVAAFDEAGALALMLPLGIAQLIQPLEQVFGSVRVGDANILFGCADFMHRERRALVLALKSGWLSSCSISLAPH